MTWQFACVRHGSGRKGQPADNRLVVALVMVIEYTASGLEHARFDLLQTQKLLPRFSCYCTEPARIVSSRNFTFRLT
jgi:hypothetical protein